MQVSQWSLEEHTARAMLLGRWYDNGDHTYNSWKLSPHVICAETLEPVNMNEGEHIRRFGPDKDEGIMLPRRVRDGEAHKD